MSGERDGNGIDFKFRAAGAEAAPHPPPLPRSYFTEQAIRAGYMAPDIGRKHENVQNPLLMRELFQIELEKERIRNDLIASEIAWRRVLEAEVRTEMMLGRELALQDRGCNVFDRFSFFPVTGMRLGARDLSLEQIEGRSLEERIAISLEKRFGNGSGHQIGGHKASYLEERRVEPKTGAGHEFISFQQRAAVPKIEVTTRTSETKPEQNIFQAKRKSLTPPRLGTTELPLIDVSEKRVKREWSCGICNAIATSERGLSDHLNGKKHKSKEAALARKRDDMMFGIGIHHKKTGKVSLLGDTSSTSSTEQGEKSLVKLLETKEAGDASLQKVNELSPMVVIPKNEQEAAGKLESKKKKYKFWCEMCQVGTLSAKIIEEHRIGKKHVKRLRLEEATKNLTVPIPLTDSNVAKNAKNLTNI